VFAGIQKSVYPAFTAFILALGSLALTGEGGPSDEVIGNLSLSIAELIGAALTGLATAVVAYVRKNVNVNGVVMSFVDRQGNVEDASGKTIGKVASGATELGTSTKLRSPAVVTVLATIVLLTLVGCGDALQRASAQVTGATGVSQADQLCIALAVAMREGQKLTIADLSQTIRAEGLRCIMTPDGAAEAVAIAEPEPTA
jgi:hypothetical protein